MSTESKPVRKLLVNDEEIELLKASFADNDDLLIAIRNLFFGFEIGNHQKQAIRTLFGNPNLKEAFRKKLYPVYQPELPIEAGAVDYWMGTEKQVLGKPIEEIIQVLGYKEKALEMLEISMNLLDDPDGPKNSLDFTTKGISKVALLESSIWLLARNHYISTVSTALNFIKAVAGTKAETASQARKRLESDSSK